MDGVAVTDGQYGAKVLHFTDPGMDHAFGELLAPVLRRDPRVAECSHQTDYDGFHLRIVTRGPKFDALEVFADACRTRLGVFESLAASLESQE